MTAMSADKIQFILNNEEVELADIRPHDTLLDFLRLRRGLTGTKEGCAEGDCGACTVLVGKRTHGGVRYESVNACIRLMPSLHGVHIVTVEHLASETHGLHPVQKAMVDQHGSQCGFCTPGIVMSLYDAWINQTTDDLADTETALQGNLCRCTGYEAIIKAAKSAAEHRPCAKTDAIIRDQSKIADRLEQIHAARSAIHLAADGANSLIPGTVAELLEILHREPEATLIAGGTDVGLWVTKQMHAISPAVFIGHMDALRQIETTDAEISIGAAVTFADLKTPFAALAPSLAALIDRIGGPQVRHMGTIGGNIGNGSPIGDLAPALITLDARVELLSAAGARLMPLEDYFIAYGRQDRRPGEFIRSIRLPRSLQSRHFAVYKVSKRRDEDISAVCAAFALTLDPDGTVTRFRSAYGGMAGTPKRASGLEAALTGAVWSRETAQAAAQMLDHDFQPLSDWRASAEYRRLTAKNLVTRFYLDTVGEA